MKKLTSIILIFIQFTITCHLPEIYTLSKKLFLPDCHHLQKDIDSNDMLIKETKKNLREASAIIFSVTSRFDTTLLQYRRGTEDYSVKV